MRAGVLSARFHVLALILCAARFDPVVRRFLGGFRVDHFFKATDEIVRRCLSDCGFYDAVDAVFRADEGRGQERV